MTEQTPVERIKRESRNLRGTLTESLADPLTGAIREDDTVLIKFHGSYQQDDRAAKYNAMYRDSWAKTLSTRREARLLVVHQTAPPRRGGRRRRGAAPRGRSRHRSRRGRPVRHGH